MMEDWSGGMSCFCHVRIGGADMDERKGFSWFLGIDISKETFDACCISGQGEKRFSISTSIDRKGFEELSKQLASLSVITGLENTPRLIIVLLLSSKSGHVKLSRVSTFLGKDQFEMSRCKAWKDGYHHQHKIPSHCPSFFNSFFDSFFAHRILYNASAVESGEM